MNFSVHCQYLVERYELVEELAQIAAGVGKYRKAAVSDRLHAFEILADRGYGKPKQSVELDASARRACNLRSGFSSMIPSASRPTYDARVHYRGSIHR